jgi:hypothetical protein
MYTTNISRPKLPKTNSTIPTEQTNNFLLNVNDLTDNTTIATQQQLSASFQQIPTVVRKPMEWFILPFFSSDFNLGEYTFGTSTIIAMLLKYNHYSTLFGILFIGKLWFSNHTVVQESTQKTALLHQDINLLTQYFQHIITERASLLQKLDEYDNKNTETTQNMTTLNNYINELNEKKTNLLNTMNNANIIANDVYNLLLQREH